MQKEGDGVFRWCVDVNCVEACYAAGTCVLVALLRLVQGQWKSTTLSELHNPCSKLGASFAFTSLSWESARLRSTKDLQSVFGCYIMLLKDVSNTGCEESAEKLECVLSRDVRVIQGLETSGMGHT
eukprot:1142389-Pelagomonas_calceolata.AAC.4